MIWIHIPLKGSPPDKGAIAKIHQKQMKFSNDTGCFRFIVKMLELITQAKKQPIS